MPEVTIISCGKDNKYGHPSKPLLERLEEIKTKIYRTDIDGTIVISSDGKSNMIKNLNVSLDGNK